jgi:hypothetical protein
MQIDFELTTAGLRPAVERMFALSAGKILDLERTWDAGSGAPVFTAEGRYTARGWTDWTEGFQHGSALIQFDATGEKRFLELGRRHTFGRMAPHVTHGGVHDHGFNVVSTFGHLWRLANEGRVSSRSADVATCVLALKVSGAVQARRWTALTDGSGFIHSFNGPHSLFVDTLRSLRALALAHQLGHVLMGEQDRRISLLERLIDHALNTARYNIYYGEARDAYDVPGRTAHEAVFNTASGSFRCPNSQQGYSPFSTWTRGLAWALCGFAEQLEWWSSAAFDRCIGNDLEALKRQRGSDFRATNVRAAWERAAQATADFYIENTCLDGIPFWDTGAPNLHRLGDWRPGVADPFNAWEPVDSSAAAIAAQGLLRLGRYLETRDRRKAGSRYWQAGLTVARTLFDAPYLATTSRHQGLILHSVYHRPNGWDRVASGQQVPNGESSMWGDYHARELGLLLLRAGRKEPWPTFFGTF